MEQRINPWLDKASDLRDAWHVAQNKPANPLHRILMRELKAAIHAMENLDAWIVQGESNLADAKRNAQLLGEELAAIVRELPWPPIESKADRS